MDLVLPPTPLPPSPNRARHIVAAMLVCWVICAVMIALTWGRSGADDASQEGEMGEVPLPPSRLEMVCESVEMIPALIPGFCIKSEYYMDLWHIAPISAIAFVGLAFLAWRFRIKWLAIMLMLWTLVPMTLMLGGWLVGLL